MTIKDTKNQYIRPPVVVVMGHIDHGKSTLLDYIRKSNVVAGEAGGITQHVGAYEAEHTTADGKKHVITFLDTPGHEAFGGIRERGAKAADIAILAVSAEDGVKPQTMDAYKEIKASKIPYIVAITKTDKPNANIDKTKTSLGEHEIYVEGWGGDIPCVPISAITGEGIPELLEMVLLVAELASLKADPSLPASGVVVESSLDTRKGVSATLLVKNGTLSVGDFVVAESSLTPIRYIESFNGLKIDSAGPSRAVRVIGWSEIPASGSLFTTTKTKKEAEKLAEQFRAENKKRNTEYVERSKEKEAGGTSAEAIILPILIKADVIGSLEGVKYELSKISNDKVKIKIAAEGIGDINEKDVKVAQGDPSVHIIGFNVEADKKAAPMIERSPVPLKVVTFKIIYELAQYVREELLKLVPKEYVEEATGRAKVLAIFSKDKDRQILGGKVESGTLESGNEVRITRRDTEIGRGKIRELQSKKLRVQEVTEGFEFGTMIESKFEIAAGDRIEAVRTIEK